MTAPFIMSSSFIQHVDDMSLSDKENGPPPAWLEVHSLPRKKALLVSLQPPTEPPVRVPHVPCDIALVIDVSTCMRAAAVVPGDDSSKDNGLSILDLVKHAALTIVETMDERDRLSIVTFSADARVVQPLKSMTDENKNTARDNINSMRTKAGTNLWDGILAGLQQFKNVNSNGKVPAIMVLTDGMPNYCPKDGYIPALRASLPMPATIHTFGFGYHLESGLLQSIAEIGNGNYSFIPDAGMIATVFLQAVANLQSTYATEATLQLQYTAGTEIEEAMGTSVLSSPPKPLDNCSYRHQLDIPLGNIQYGQSRDVFLRFYSPHMSQFGGMDRGPLPVVKAKFTYKLVLGNDAGNPTPGGVTCDLMKESPLPKELVAYHESRARICSFLSGICPIGNRGEHKTICRSQFEKVTNELAALIKHLPSRLHPDPLNTSLMQDLTGQVSMALGGGWKDFTRWGQHFLPSLRNAHYRQVCIAKDPGPLQYGKDSSFLDSCRDTLMETFVSLPAPKRSRTTHMAAGHGLHGGAFRASTDPGLMSSYIDPKPIGGLCFAGSTLLRLASGRDIEIQHVRRGLKLRTPLGSRKVVAVLRTPVVDEELCRVGDVLVTPWHPVARNGKAWAFPNNVCDARGRFTGDVYSIMLQPDGDPDAHALCLGRGRLWGVTLGHGVTAGDGDARAHSFFGDYEAVIRSLWRLPKGLRGEFEGSGVRRDARTGLVCAFRKDKSRARAVTTAQGARRKTIRRV